MALTNIERIRLKIGDRPVLRRESNVGDAVATHFKMRYEPMLSSAGREPKVWVNDALQVENTDYVVDYEQGVFAFTLAPAANARLVFQYYSIVWSDSEVQDYIDQYTNLTIAAAQVMLAWAADIAKLAKRETRQGGAGVGAITLDTSVASKELRATAAALLEYELEHGVDVGSAVPAEGLTEVPWTEQNFYDIVDQEFIREN